MSEDITEVFRRLGLSDDVRVIVCGGPDNSALAIGEAFHKAMEDQLHTTPMLTLGSFDEVEAPVLKEALQKLSEENFELPTLVFKYYEGLTPVDTYKPKQDIKRPSFRDKKYF